MKTVYIETSIISYLTARPSKNLIAVARQLQTCEWWDIYRQNYTLFTSNLVIAEASQGDTQRSRERLNVLRKIERLAINTACEELGEKLIVHSYIPPYLITLRMMPCISLLQVITQLIFY